MNPQPNTPAPSHNAPAQPGAHDGATGPTASSESLADSETSMGQGAVGDGAHDLTENREASPNVLKK